MTTFEQIQRAEGLVDIGGERQYVVDGVDRMPPFLMSVVSDGDRWMFVSSSGGLTAGRRDATQALFPYVTDDRLHGAAGSTGPVTALRVGRDDQPAVWCPFTDRPDGTISRSVAKSVVSDWVRFEEHHRELDLTFTYRWGSSDRFGFVRTATVHNTGPTRTIVDVLDGLVDLLPYGLEPAVYQRFSNLTHAYKRSELIDAPTGLALYTLESPVSDRAEPEEVLRATVVWSTGLDGSIDLDARAVSSFRDGVDTPPRDLVTGVAGAYLRRGRFELEAGGTATWHIVADVGRDQVDVSELRHELRGGVADLGARLVDATRQTGERLVRIVAPADASQSTGDEVACAHHLSNVIYNVMRGGVPLDGYRIDTRDLAGFVTRRNRVVAERRAAWVATLPPGIDRRALRAQVAAVGDPDLVRLVDEYLPFSFSRRHGDPSRPWNDFSIRVTGDDSEPIRYFEGNWRDVFQNWEALCASFPDYLPGVVSTFVNASTADGHNPYRITSDGIDWEVPDPDDPWANIGYWGDHQVVYLLRLLDSTEAYFPGLLAGRLDDRTCTYADVPYRIAPYADLVRDPKSTIAFDAAAADRSTQRTDAIGADGKLVVGADGELVRVCLAEKLLVVALAKLSNFVPGGGIWMNTQRPEWNDANNALVGNGLSMVTLFHLRRYLDRLRDLVASRVGSTAAPIVLSAEVAVWLGAVTEALDGPPVGHRGGAASELERRALLDRLGAAGSDYRSVIYATGFSGTTTPVATAEVEQFCDRAIAHLDATAAGARRGDGLVHSYNLIRFPDSDRAVVEHLPEMLEGQVAALTQGLFTPREQADLIDALFASALHRDDLDTFTLAPPVRPASFLDKNVIEPLALAADPLLSALVAAGDTSIVRSDADGRHRFAPDLTSSARLDEQLDELARHERWTRLVSHHRAGVVSTYDTVFDHHAHLGRSGAMYGYEGIGSVYWHMVTKLLLAVQEAASHAVQHGADRDAVTRLTDSYWRVRSGLGVNMSARRFGAIPIDPYSHTPAHAGAQQPGMTGAVKEEILARPRELGVRVDDGRIVFDDLLLREAELLERPMTWMVRTVDDREVAIDLAAGSTGLTVCQVPVVVATTDDEPSIEVEFADGRTSRLAGDRLDRAVSDAVFRRTGVVTVVRAAVRRGLR